ncbi:MAG: ribbon-helix-helix protein, CopG family [Burkholderiales bacterium]|nr:ribbon-helix-helix protein, CopG family [Burkholderiales bacterium]
MLTVKMEVELERQVQSAARAAGLTKSEFVRRCLHEGVARAARDAKPTPWELGKDLFGKVASGNASLSRTRARDLVASRRRAKDAD